jgi:transketolase
MTSPHTDLISKCRDIRRETIRVNRVAPETRLASSLSAVEILVALYYGGILRYRPEEPLWAGRDRFIASKGHGSIAMFPILADLGYFPASELARVCQEGTFLGGIPDSIIPGYETTNGSLGHGVGVGCGMAIALTAQGNPCQVVVMVGDGELYEGSVWEAFMFAAARKLSNLVVVVDANQAAMLNFCREIIDLEPLEARFTAFGWLAQSVDGHDVLAVRDALAGLTASSDPRPKVLIARTIKGKGVPSLEGDPLAHIKNPTSAELDELIRRLS